MIVEVMESLGDNGAAALAGALVGAVFGFSAQRSRFCLRAATVEFARGNIGPRTSVWLLCFATAVFWTQALTALDLVALNESRFLAQPGSLSGAVLGGAMVGAGMVLARGCPGRLLVLSATGNLRTLLAGLVFAISAQMTLHGALGPARAWIAGSWTTGADGYDLLANLALGQYAGIVFGALVSLAAILFALRAQVGFRTILFGSGVGFAVGAGYFLTSVISAQAFDPVTVESLTFSGPSANTLMWFLTPSEGPEFDTGLVPGVFLGAMLAAILSREVQLVGFEGAAQMPRYLIGAAMMGVGAMLAGGCAIGAGVSGTSTFALAPWVALSAMWAAAMLTDAIVDRPRDVAALAAE